MKKGLEKTEEKVHFKIMIPVILFIVYGIIDYLNIPQLFGLSSERFNMDFFDVFLNATIVIALYIATYIFIDRKEIQRNTNARDTADVLLLCTYTDCYDNLKMVCDTNWVREYIIPKVDGNKPPNDNRVISNIQNFPFESKQELLELSKGGYIEKDALQKYFRIQKEYKHMISMRITFYDLSDPMTDEQRALFINIEQRCIRFLSMLEEEIARLEGNLNG